jgi:hypothetical protein
MADLFSRHKLSVTTTAEQNRHRLYHPPLDATRPISPFSVPAALSSLPHCCTTMPLPRPHPATLPPLLPEVCPRRACPSGSSPMLCAPVSVAGCHDAPAPSSICAGGLGAGGPSSSPCYCSSRPSSGSTSQIHWRMMTRLVARCSLAC